MNRYESSSMDELLLKLKDFNTFLYEITTNFCIGVEYLLGDKKNHAIIIEDMDPKYFNAKIHKDDLLFVQIGDLHARIHYDMDCTESQISGFS